jgi:hypothetical protein
MKIILTLIILTKFLLIWLRLCRAGFLRGKQFAYIFIESNVTGIGRVGCRQMLIEAFKAVSFGGSPASATRTARPLSLHAD